MDIPQIVIAAISSGLIDAEQLDDLRGRDLSKAKDKVMDRLNAAIKAKKVQVVGLSSL